MHTSRDLSTPDSPYVESHTKPHSHHGHSHTHSKAGNKRKANRVQRACLNCRKRKQGCEEERPCRRCVEKGIECVEVEAKRKRGRAKTSSAHRERSKDYANSEVLPDYDEDSAEDSYESEDEEVSSEDDQSTLISPRETSSNSVSNNENVMQPFTLNLNMSNTGSNSNLHTVSSSSHTAARSHQKSNLNSSVSLSNSSSAIPFLKERNTGEEAHKERGKESKRERVTTPTPANDYLDHSSAADVDDDLSSECSQLDSNHGDDMEDNLLFFNKGINMALLLPLIGNLSNVNEDQYSASTILMEDEYGYRLECEETSLMNGISFGSPSNSSDQLNQYAGLNKLNNDSVGDDMTFTSKIWSNDFCFYTNSILPKSLNVDEGDTKAQVYLKECCEEFQQTFKHNDVEEDLQQVNDRWKDILKCLRNLDWQKAQSLMDEMERLPLRHYGEHIQPSVVCWSSGGRIHHANEAFCNTVGYTAEELKVDDMNISQFNNFNRAFGSFGLYRDKVRIHSIFHPEEMMKITKKQLDAVQHPEKSFFQLNTRLLSKMRMEIPISCSILNLRDSSGLPLLTIAVFV